MKANPGKSNIMLSSNIQGLASFDNVQITSSLSEKLFGMTFNSELKFEEHIRKNCNIAKKLNALHCIVNHMSLDKQTKKIILKVLLNPSLAISH